MEVLFHPMPMEQPKFENCHIHIWSHYVFAKIGTYIRTSQTEKK
jgi:hypothetical protein